MIEHVAQTVTETLLERDLITLAIPVDTLTAEVRRLITDDLLVEDRLNDEVKQILQAHTSEIDRGNIDYSRMFAMVKRQLVKERGLIL
jgi:hypothetical protein